MTPVTAWRGSMDDPAVGGVEDEPPFKRKEPGFVRNENNGHFSSWD
jgi:hypothetical protein